MNDNNRNNSNELKCSIFNYLVLDDDKQNFCITLAENEY